ncbi:MAG: hypothetical protein JW789_00515 [Candidatus Aenigmarchaeota archaeon]|nr:hypothetical protein [Candidatus Aenigmarchaeota archaeon]
MEPENSRRVIIPGNNPFMTIYIPEDEFSHGDRSDHAYPSRIGIVNDHPRSSASGARSGVISDDQGNLKKYYTGF